MEKLVFSEYEREHKRYSRWAMASGFGAYGIFLLTIGVASCLLLLPEFERWLKAQSEFFRIVSAISLVLVAGAISLTMLYLAIHKLRKNPLLNCPACSQQVVDYKAWRQVFSDGTCRHCNTRIVEKHELPQSRIPAFHLSHAILILGIFLIGISAFISRDRAIILLCLGVANVVAACWSLWRIKHAQATN